jgi:toxin ParE1/3/4
MTRIATKRPEAERDIEEITLWVAQGGWAVAERFIAAVDQACALLADMPQLGPSCEFENPAAADVRFWPMRRFENYLLFYRPTDNGIEVLRIIHGARNYQRFFE